MRESSIDNYKMSVKEMNNFKEQFSPMDIIHYGTKRHSGRYPYG